MPQIPAGWKETTLGEVVEFIDWDRGKNYPNWDDFKTTWFCVFLNAKNLPNRIFDFSETMFISEEKDLILRKGKLKRWDYVMTTRWTIGNFAYYNDQVVYSNMRINSWMVIIRAYKDLINEKFLWLFFSSNIFKYYLSWFTSWSAVPQLPIKDIKQLPILLPPLPEQQAIAAVLSSFDDKIELLRVENQTLEQMGQELFKERFGKWKVGDELPEGWRVGKLSEIADFLNGLPLQKYPAIEWEESLPVIKIREMKSWITDQTGRASADIDQKYIVQDWDVLFSRSGSLELVFWEYWPWALNQHLFKVTSSTYPKRFYYYWILYHLPEFRVIANTKATTMGHIQRGHLDLAKVTIPDSESLIAFDKVMSKIIQKLLDNKEQIQTLSATRDQLLPKLMSGEVRVEF